MRSLRRLTEHATPQGYPKYGYMLEEISTNTPRVVGVILLIYTDIVYGGVSHVRCNVSSWYVEPEFQFQAPFLAARATKRPDVTYFNVSPAPHTWDILRNQGFQPFAAGRTIFFPWLQPALPEVTVRDFSLDTITSCDLPMHEITLLHDHQRYGCFSLICETDGQCYPFVFGKDTRRGLLRVAHLVYCRSMPDFARFAGNIGRFLAGRGSFVMKFHSNKRLPGIIGFHSAHHPKFLRGGVDVYAGDVAYSEQVMFGY